MSIHPHFWHYILRSAHLRTLSQEAAQYYNGREPTRSTTCRWASPLPLAPCCSRSILMVQVTPADGNFSAQTTTHVRSLSSGNP